MRIFLCYRRDDSSYVADRIYEWVAREFGRERVFKDVDSIPLGQDFLRVLREAVSECDVLLAVIGRTWLTAADASGRRRLDNPGDFVRIEIEAALERDIPIIPLLVDKAAIPGEADLPESIKALAFRNGTDVRPDPDFAPTMERLVGALRRLAPPHPECDPEPPTPTGRIGAKPTGEGARPSGPAPSTEKDRPVEPATGRQPPGGARAPSRHPPEGELHKYEHGGSLRPPVHCVAFAPDGRHALSGAERTGLVFWDLETGKKLLQIVVASIFDIYAAAFTPDGRRALIGGRGILALWDLHEADAAARGSVGSKGPMADDLVRPLAGHSAEVISVAIAHDSRFAVSGSYDKTLRYWDLKAGRQLRCCRHVDIARSVALRLKGLTDYVRSVAIAPSGHFALSGGDIEAIRLWNLETGKEERRLVGHTGSVRSVAFAPNGLSALSGSEDGTVRLWDLRSGREVWRFGTPSSPVGSVAFSPDGRRALSGNRFGSVYLWEVETGRELCHFTGHAGSVNSVAFAPDGRRALSGSDDNTMRLWSLPE